MIVKNQLDLKDEFSPFIGKVVGIVTESNDRFPLCGRLLSISKDFLNIQKLDGRMILISKLRVLEIWETHDQKDILVKQ